MKVSTKIKGGQLLTLLYKYPEVINGLLPEGRQLLKAQDMIDNLRLKRITETCDLDESENINHVFAELILECGGLFSPFKKKFGKRPIRAIRARLIKASSPRKGIEPSFRLTW